MLSTVGSKKYIYGKKTFNHACDFNGRYREQVVAIVPKEPTETIFRDF